MVSGPYQTCYHFPLILPFMLQGLSHTRVHVTHMVGMPENLGILEYNIQPHQESFGPISPIVPHIALLNSPIPKKPKHMQKLIFFMLLGAKITIAKAWK